MFERDTHMWVPRISSHLTSALITPNENHHPRFSAFTDIVMEVKHGSMYLMTRANMCWCIRMFWCFDVVWLFRTIFCFAVCIIFRMVVCPLSWINQWAVWVESMAEMRLLFTTETGDWTGTERQNVKHSRRRKAMAANTNIKQQH